MAKWLEKRRRIIKYKISTDHYMTRQVLPVASWPGVVGTGHGNQGREETPAQSKENNQ